MFFSRKKPPLAITTPNYTIRYYDKHKWWGLDYRDIEFIFCKREIDLPNTEDLDKYISWVTNHQKMIDENVKEMLIGWAEDEESAFKATHISMIEIEELERIQVMIMGNEEWGDMGYDLTIVNGQITMDGFGD